MSMKRRVQTEQRRIVGLAQSVFVYLLDCLNDRDGRAMRRFELRPDQIARLRELAAIDVMRLGEFGENVLHVAIDEKALDEALMTVTLERRRRALIERCLRRDAPRAMMSAFFGLSRQRYAAARVDLGLRPTPGRLSRPAEGAEHRVYEAWMSAGRGWTPEILLRIAETLDLSLRVVWGLLHPYTHRRSPPPVPSARPSAPRPTAAPAPQCQLEEVRVRAPRTR